MGEAKRRKQLGLMPTVYPFEAEVTNEAKAKLVRAPDDPKLRDTLINALEHTQLSGDAWASEYRTALVLAGQYHNTLYTAEDVQKVPVPALRRIAGEVVLDKKLDDVEGVAIAFDGGVIRLREQRHSFDGQKWESFPALRDPQKVQRLLSEHPAFGLEGELIGQYRVDQWAEGRIDVDPEPPEGMLELLEDSAREWHGSSPAQWEQLHTEFLGDHATAEQEAAPLARRSYFELRKPAPLQNPTRNIFNTRHNTEIYPLVGQLFTHDGETWHAYEHPDKAVEDELAAGIADLFNMETVVVTVYADGRVEWDEGEVPEPQAERVRADLLETTGAGNPEKWANWTRNMLLDTFYLEDQEGVEIPVPQAVKLDIAKDAIADPDPLTQTLIESEVTFDGENWRDLYEEEVPQELLLALTKLRPLPSSPADEGTVG